MGNGGGQRGGNGAAGGGGAGILLIIAILAILQFSGLDIVGFLIKAFWVVVIGILLIAATVAGVLIWKKKKRQQKIDEENIENLLNMEIKSPEQEELDNLAKKYGTSKPVQPIDLSSKKGETVPATSGMSGKSSSEPLSSVFSDDKFK